MVTSITSQLAALQAISQLASQLEVTQLRVTTGLKVTGPQVSPSAFAIAENLRGDVSGVTAVKTALGTGEATVEAAISAGQSIENLLDDIRSTVVSATASGLNNSTREALHNDFISLRDQITSVVQSAEFNNINLVQSASTTLTVLSTAQGSTVSITSQALDTTSLAINNFDLTKQSGAASALTVVATAITTASDRVSTLGASLSRLEAQTEFIDKTIDLIEGEISNQVDADLTAESAKLTALQIQQQIAVQALAIANASPQNLLALFQRF
jgi:flagellin